MPKQLCLALCFFVFSAATHNSYGQDSTSLYGKIYYAPDKIFTLLNKKASNVEAKLLQATEKSIKKFARHENKMKRRLRSLDSATYAQLYGNSQINYEQLSRILKTNNVNGQLHSYSSRLDSMQTVLKFLESNKIFNGASSVQQVQKLLSQYNGLQNTLIQTNYMSQLLVQRQAQLKETLQKFGLTKQFKKFQQEIYYYRTKVDKYRQYWEDPSQAESKILEIVTQIPAFKDFFARYSTLGRLFPMPSTADQAALNIVGLQTRETIRRQLEDRFGGQIQIQQRLNQEMPNAQQELNKLKNKISSLGRGAEGMEMPDFKPNSQKSKSILQRLEFGTNIQSVKHNSFFPVTTDIGLSIGYKLNDRSVIGIGGSYKIGWGNSLNKINITHQGVGIRSFIDWKLKGSFYISGGYEQNYAQQIRNLDQLRDVSAWLQSGLIGISKKYTVGKKKAETKILFDFLYKSHIPQTQPLLFRVGYTL